MVNYLVVKAHFDTNKLAYITFYPVSKKAMKALIRHLPQNSPPEDVSDGLVDLGLDIITVKQRSSTRRSCAEAPIFLPLYLITLPRMAKS
jgi:hypothetical protein